MLFDPQTLSIFVLAVIALAASPGPDMMFIAANGIARGARAGAVSALGVGLGCLVHTTLAAAGVSALVLASPVAFDVIRFAGAAYLLWLAVRAIRNPVALNLHAAGARGRSLGAVFRGGVLTNVLNPKVAVFFIAFLPQFADPSRGPIALQMLVLGVLLTVIGTGLNALVGLSGGGIGRFLASRPRFARMQGWVSGLIFIGLAARLATTGRTS